MEYTIELLTPENFAKCENIPTTPGNPARTKIRQEEVLAGKRFTYVAVVNGDYVGEGSLLLEKEDPHYTIPGWRGYLSLLRVRPEHQNQGMGSAILDALAAHAKALGLKELSLGVDTANPAARRLYERKGFTTLLFRGEDEEGEFVKLLKTL